MENQIEIGVEKYPDGVVLPRLSRVSKVFEVSGRGVVVADLGAGSCSRLRSRLLGSNCVWARGEES